MAIFGIATVGLDLAKNVFQVRGADVSGRAVRRKKLRRAKPWLFSESCSPASLPRGHVRAPIFGVARLESWAMRSG